MNLYIVLGVEPVATLDEIKRAYKRLARRFHPDINPGDRMAAQQFHQIAQAYETLSDPERRRRYDANGTEAVPGDRTTTFGFEGFDFSVSVSGQTASTFGDLFADVLQARTPGRTAHPERGADLHLTVTLGFEEALRGGTRDLVVTRQDLCRACHGRGRVQARETACAACHGSGAVRSVRGHMVFSKACDACNGSGRQAAAPCPACGGRQMQLRSDTLRVALPAGIADGDHIRIAGQGHAGPGGQAAGDLQLTVQVEPHPVFRRDGDDVHLTVPVAIHEAALGARIDVPAIDGAPARVRVPPGTQSGQRFRLRERGAPSARHAGRGDLVVEVRLTLPATLDERSKDLLREFGRINEAAAIRSDPTPATAGESRS